MSSENEPPKLGTSPRAAINALPRPSSRNRDNPPRLSSTPSSSHRHSLSDALRGVPPSPHSRRQSSITGSQAVQDLLNNPPLPHRNDSPFEGRDWKKVRVGEIIDPEEVHWAEVDTTVEEATNALINRGPPNCVLVRQDKRSRMPIDTFDYSDLNSYLLLVVGIAQPEEGNTSLANAAQKAREGKPVLLREIKDIGKREAFVALPESASLTTAVEILGSGVHRIIVMKETGQDVLSVLTQLRLVRFFWENGRNFPAVDSLYPSNLQELSIGSRSVKSINGDKPLIDALQVMHSESITSLPVIDNHSNVVGNISHVDCRLLTKSTSLPLLRSSCIHFISVILSSRGVDDGKDSYPVFYVNPFSTLAHTVAKLVATRSHRMWIVDAPSPASSAPSTPAPVNTVMTLGGPYPASGQHHPMVQQQYSVNEQRDPSPSKAGPGPHPTGSLYAPPAGLGSVSAVSASSLPGQHMSGRLSGVISLTDVLNVIARASGLQPHDPEEARRRRRGSSSSSMRMSIDSARSSSVDLSRTSSVSGAGGQSRR